MTRYLILIERGEHNYGAYVPDVPGCVAVGDTPDEAKQRLQEALADHLELMQQYGEAIPQPAHTAAYVDVDLPSPTTAPAPKP